MKEKGENFTYKQWNKWKNKMSRDTAKTCFITAGQTAADPCEQGQQSCPLHQEKVLTTGSVSTSHQQEWVPNKRHNFKWISEWTLNVEWSVWQRSQVSCWRACQKQSSVWTKRRRSRFVTWGGNDLWTDLHCAQCVSDSEALTFMRNENELSFMSVIYRMFHLWATTEHPIWMTSVTLKRGTVVLVEPLQVRPEWNHI